jgi:acyl-CoA dehydrogenase
LNLENNDRLELIRNRVRELCLKYPNSYWRSKDKEKKYPEEFVLELTSSGLLSALIPSEYGGGGLGLIEGGIILEEINRSGGNSAACHAQMYTMGVILRHGSEDQRKRYLPKIARGDLRLQAFAVTEPEAGIDTTKIRTHAVKKNGEYIVNGRKIFTSRMQHSDLLVLLARTSPYDNGNKTSGLSIFLVDLRNDRKALRAEPIETMINHETNELFIEDLHVPEENLIGKEGEGFQYILDGINAERILIASECIGDAEFCLERAVEYAKNRVVFDRPIGQNQGVQFPLARVYVNLKAADLMRLKASSLYDSEKPCGSEANMAKLLASEVSLEAANVAMTTLGGNGMATNYDVERKYRESRLFIVAPIPNYMILSYVAEHVLSLPRSY